MRWMDKLMTKVYSGNNKLQQVSTQTIDDYKFVDELIPSGEISLNIEDNEINPYQCKVTQKNRNLTRISR